VPTIEVIVEGDGDRDAIPILMRTRLAALEIFDVDIGRPINAKGRGNLLREGQLERWLQLAALRDDVCGILVVCDTEGDPACDLGPALARRGAAAVPPVLVRLTLAVRQFENWIVASGESTNEEAQDENQDFEALPATEIIRRWRAPRSYVKPIHQPRYAARIDHVIAARRCRSFARLLRCIDELARECSSAADGDEA